MFSKLVTAVISPLGTGLLLGLSGLLLLGLAQRRHWTPRLGVGLLAVALGWIWLWSLPVASDALRGWIEDQAGPRLMAELPSTEVLVVLGGGMSGPRPPRRPDADLGSAADRVWHAARLFHTGKAQQLLLSGGQVRSGDGSAAQAMRGLLLDLGVPDQAIRLKALSTNTATNASEIAALLKADGVDELMLVTSALHMPRARAQFERAGLRVVPAPTDFEVIEMPLDLLQLIPSAAALDGSARAFKELLGRWVGR